MKKLAAGTVGLLLLALAAAAATGAFDREIRNHPDDTRIFASNDPVERGCSLADRIVTRLWRGHHPVHSEDVTIVPHFPNYSGTFKITSHSGPWDYLQNVPLVFYGPQSIRSWGKPVAFEATLADVYPTVAELVDVPLPQRTGRILADALKKGGVIPKLVVVVVWDGVGRNVLERWPDAWPTLARLEREGTSYAKAMVGSSPSITPATHSTLGTGAYPRDHGVTAIEYRTRDGRVRGAFAGKDPSDLRLTTFADEIDLRLGNVPRAGMLAWKSWHMGMLGHGSSLEGADKDELALIGKDIAGNDAYYVTPPGIAQSADLEEHADRLDQADGRRDGRWRGHEVLARHDNPAWVTYETELLLEMLRRGEYGADEVPDFFFVNYKMSDIAAHQYTMDSPEVEEVLRAQDAALAELVNDLDSRVGEYVVIVTSDHGHTPSPERSGAWPILQGQLAEDVNRHFGAPPGEPLIKVTTAAGPFLDRQVMERLGVTRGDVAKFLNGYTIAQNWNQDELPEGYEGRGDENVLAAAFGSDQYREVVRCAGIPRAE